MPTRPNVLIVMTDQQKATSSHLYGSTFCETPSLERLANEGTLFENAFTPHPLCVPARVSFWLSQWPHTHGARRNQTMMPQGANHAARIWHDHGYRLGLIGKNHCFEAQEDVHLFDTWMPIGPGAREAPPKSDWHRSLDGVEAAARLRRGLEPQNPRFGYAALGYPPEDHSTDLIAGEAIHFLEEHGSDPFALWVSIPDPHEPWMVAEKYAAMFPPDKIDLPPWRDGEFDDERAPERNRVLYKMLGMDEDSTEDIYGVMAAYFGMVRFMDDCLGQILDALESNGLRENTIVVFCSDHGDFMGEHRMQCKGGVFYDSLTRVPLIVSWPGQVEAGVRDASMANLVDIVPTLLQLQGMEAPKSMQGAPLPTVTDAAPRDATFSEYGSGGPLFTMADLEKLPKPWGRKTLIDTLQWREAAGRCKMVRTREWKYV
ncbi:MAG: sulfatase-like hydrolase/transferase, partial [Candidatus Poribacteria bacterium]